MKVMAIKDYNKMQERKYRKAVAGWKPEKGGFPFRPMYFFYDENQGKRITGFVAISNNGRGHYYGETEAEAKRKLFVWEGDKKK